MGGGAAMAAASSSVFLPAIGRPRSAVRGGGVVAAVPRRSAVNLRGWRVACASAGEKEGEESGELPAAAAEERKEMNVEAAEAAEAAEETARKLMMSRQGEGGGGDLWSGVGEEVREIEWPAFGKVLGTTGVVLAVIGSSSVALLTVNGVLAELSDRVFAGRGVQDFFG
ncbi:secE/sec61-gamma protein transport protein [Wolffia australiana]